MGPYCRFCNQRCFERVPEETPADILAALGTASILATCREGQKFDRQATGWGLDTIQMAIMREQADRGEFPGLSCYIPLPPELPTEMPPPDVLHAEIRRMLAQLEAMRTPRCVLCN